MHFSESDWIACCGSSKFAKEMAKVGPFKNLAEAIEMSRQIWWNQVDVPGWLEAFGAHPRIGALSSKSTTDWCAEEQATALSSANDRALKLDRDLYDVLGSSRVESALRIKIWLRVPCLCNWKE
ncbi:uric acid degradation bifunctional protein TTL [Selaginella moellendorffii]|uniref:uric acid degradation bifunctional protein TTL n=1 Tax=Selaginella moellendorffii TaxID=88036 RepID=UPI000D1CFA4F|nr:uric acid degradation bifunctional protein TTL [Selaginella moellendorffii]|eukprot:XP_024544913.1 uric acid degradation bifunctional protein TTL [Selaginella moellendorffii]